MVSTQTLKLLDALLAGSSGSETEKLKALYKEAYCSTQCFKDLKTLLERSEFHGTTGHELLRQSEEVVQAGFSNAGSFGDSLTVMEYLVEKITQERQATREYVCSARVNGQPLNVIDKRLADQATEYYEKLFGYVCCLYASLYGDTILKNINVKTGIRSTDLIRNMDDELVILTTEARRQQQPRAWRILRKTFGGVNPLRYSGFVLEYGNFTPEYLKNQCRQLTPTLYVPQGNSDVLCCGIGYLTSLDIADGSTIFGASVTTDPALNCLDNLELEYSSLSISQLLGKIAGGSGVCILKPEALVELLNRYFMIQAAKKNQSNLPVDPQGDPALQQPACALCGLRNCRHYQLKRGFTMDSRTLDIVVR